MNTPRTFRLLRQIPRLNNLRSAPPTIGPHSPCVRPLSSTPSRSLKVTPPRREKEVPDPYHKVSTKATGTSAGPHEGSAARTDRDIVVEYPPEEEFPRDRPLRGRGGIQYVRTLPTFNLEGRTVVVTGGARGLGLVMGQGVVQSGADLAIVDLNKEEGEKQAAELMSMMAKENTDSGSDNYVPKVTAHYADVSDPDSVNVCIAEILKEHGKIDHLVTSAGFTENFSAETYPYERMKKLWGVNVDGTYLFSTAVGRHLMERNITHGSIVMIGSMSGAIVNVPQPQAPYNAAKAAVRHLAASLAVEWAHAHIRVNCISPGYMLTALTRKILDDNPELNKTWTSLIPVGKMGSPEDLQGAVVYLLSDASRYVTGADLRVDGGSWKAWRKPGDQDNQQDCSMVFIPRNTAWYDSGSNPRWQIARPQPCHDRLRSRGQRRCARKKGIFLPKVASHIASKVPGFLLSIHSQYRTEIPGALGIKSSPNIIGVTISSQPAASAKEIQSRPDKYIEMSAEPVTERAWCFQERALSRRVLQVASDQMYFECNMGFRSEDGLHLPTRYFTLHGRPESCFLPGPRQPGLDSTISLWYNILWSYGPRKLTDGSDKLPVFAGIAAVFADRLKDQYVAGIWRKSLIEGLLWQGLDISEVEVREPSWSWLSINGVPASGLIGRWEPLACILDCHVDLVGESQFGQVKSGVIKMEAPLLPLTLVESNNRADDTETDLPLYPKHLLFRTAGGKAGSRGRFDFIGQRHADAEKLARDGQVFALILAVSVGDPSHRLMIYHSLLVTPVDGGDGRTIRRLGFVNQEIESLGVEEARTSRTIVTFV